MSRLQELFGWKTKAAEYEIFKELFNANMKEGGEVVDHTQNDDWTHPTHVIPRIHHGLSPTNGFDPFVPSCFLLLVSGGA